MGIPGVLEVSFLPSASRDILGMLGELSGTHISPHTLKKPV